MIGFCGGGAQSRLLVKVQKYTGYVKKNLSFTKRGSPSLVILRGSELGPIIMTKIGCCGAKGFLILGFKKIAPPPLVSWEIIPSFSENQTIMLL